MTHASSNSERSNPRTRRQASGVSAERSETGGGELERRIGRIEFAEGAHVRLRVPVPAEDSDPRREVLTDIDVLSLDVDLRLSVTRSSVECKSGQGQSGEASTLIWLAGFRQLLGLHRVALARPTASSRGRALARRLGIGVVDEGTLRAREQAHQWIPERFAHLDGAACQVAERRTDVQLRGLPDIPGDIAAFLRGPALLAPPARLLGAVEALGRGYERQGILPEPAATVLASHALIGLLVAALQHAEELGSRSERDVRERLLRSLTLGDPDDSQLLPLLERADDLLRYVVERTHRAYIDAGAEPARFELPSIAEAVVSPPVYLEDYFDLVARLRANPLVARDLLQTAELGAFEGLVGGSAWRVPAFAHLFTAEHRGLLAVAVRTLASVAGEQVAIHVREISTLRPPGVDDRVPDRRAVSSTAARTIDETRPTQAREEPNPTSDPVAEEQSTVHDESEEHNTEERDEAP